MSSSPQPLIQAVLQELLDSKPSRVSYDQIESAMSRVGLDPYQDEEAYIAIIEALEDTGLAIVYSLDDETSTEPLEAFSHELRSVLDDIREALADDSRRLLAPEEEIELLEIRRAGLQAKEELEETVNEEKRKELQERIKLGKQAEEELLKRNVRLVAKWVQKFGSHAQHLDMDDLVQEGMIGLMKAIQRFDIDSNLRLSTYATWWIRQAITRAIADQDRIIRYPVHILDKLQKYRMAVKALESLSNESPTEIEIAYEMGLLSENPSADKPTDIEKAIQEVKKLRLLESKHVTSLDLVVGDGENSVLGEFIHDDRSLDPETLVLFQAFQEEISKILQELDMRERRVIEYRFGLNGNTPMTLQEIGDMWGITRERVRQIEQKALRKLQYPTLTRRLEDFRFM